MAKLSRRKFLKKSGKGLAALYMPLPNLSSLLSKAPTDLIALSRSLPEWSIPSFLHSITRDYYSDAYWDTREGKNFQQIVDSWNAENKYYFEDAKESDTENIYFGTPKKNDTFKSIHITKDAVTGWLIDHIEDDGEMGIGKALEFLVNAPNNFNLMSIIGKDAAQYIANKMLSSMSPGQFLMKVARGGIDLTKSQSEILGQDISGDLLFPNLSGKKLPGIYSDHGDPVDIMYDFFPGFESYIGVSRQKWKKLRLAQFKGDSAASELIMQKFPETQRLAAKVIRAYRKSKKRERQLERKEKKKSKKRKIERKEKDPIKKKSTFDRRTHAEYPSRSGLEHMDQPFPPPAESIQYIIAQMITEDPDIPPIPLI